MATEKRLIDANALMKAIKSFRWFGVPNTLQLMFDYLKIIIRDQPTVDAVEVVHGRWEMLGDDYANCTNCGNIFETRPTPMFFKANNKYCRNCGAKMDGDGNG